MSLQIEDAIREQLSLLERKGCTINQFVDVVAQLGRASPKSKLLVRSVLEEFRKSGQLSEDVARRTTPAVFPSPAADCSNDSTIPLHSEGASKRSSHFAPSASIVLGQVLRERYVIQQRLGAGGHGSVFKALDRYRASLPESQQYVALKILHSCGACPEQTSVDRQRALHRSQTLSHRNVVNVFELDRDADVTFFTMELLEGEPLSGVMERLHPATVSRSHAWQLIRQLGAGLEHAHDRDVIHGDLKPDNILITRSGELRILNFGTAHRFVRVDPLPGQPDFAPVSGSSAYASCELLEGRSSESRDDLYALACICYELLTGTHPFDSRPATLARNYDVQVVRPAGLTGRQWRTLQAGLSWHRAGRSMSVRSWMQRLATDRSDEPTMTPLHALVQAEQRQPKARSWTAAALLAPILSIAAGVVLLRTSSVQPTRSASPSMAPASVTIQDKAPAPPAILTPADLVIADPKVIGSTNAAQNTHEPKAASTPIPVRISVDNYQVRSGDRFVEIRVHRNQLGKNGSFTWWTEPATAKQGVDYVHQSKVNYAFPMGGRSKRFYVKLFPNSARTQRDFFYVAIAQSGRGQSSGTVTRTPIWLPIPRDQLQARR